MIDRAVVEQALEALEARCGTFADERQPGGVIPVLRAALAQEPTPPPEAEKIAYAAGWWAAMMQRNTQDAEAEGSKILRISIFRPAEESKV